jgi:phage-related protein
MDRIKARIDELAARLTSTAAQHEKRIQALEQARQETDRLLWSHAAARRQLRAACREASARHSRTCSACQEPR